MPISPIVILSIFVILIAIHLNLSNGRHTKSTKSSMFDMYDYKSLVRDMMIYVCVQTGHNKSLVITTGSCISVHVDVIEYAYRSQSNNLYLCKLDSNRSQSVDK